MANWYSTDWWHRVPVLLRADKAGGATHADFPALLAASLPAHFWTRVRADGLDCMLTQADGVTPLFREVATFDAGTEKPEIHFRLPSYSHLEDTLVYLYYRNPDYSEPSDVEVWDSSFAAVYHMNDDPSDSTQILDSTANANHGTKGADAAAPVEVAGTLGRAQEFVEANRQTIDLGNRPSWNLAATGATFSVVWQGVHASDILRRFVGGSPGAGYHIGAYASPDGRAVQEWRAADGTSPVLVVAGSNVLDDETHYIAFSTDVVAKTVHGRCDALTSSRSFTGTPLDHNTRLGISQPPYYLDGLIHELRLSSVARSAEWIEAEYNWLLNNALCYEVGDYENRPLYIMQGYRRVKDAATFDAQAYRRLTLPAGYIAQAYRRLADRALYTLATKRRLRPLYRAAGRIRYPLD